jgi:hypothetical protein
MGDLRHREMRRGGLGLIHDRKRNMSVDIDAIAPAARKRYLLLGRRYITANVLAQAEKTMRGLTKYGPLLVDHGFGEEDGQDLTGVTAALRQQDTGSAQALGLRKMTSQTTSGTFDKGKLGRRSLRSILSATMRVLGEKGEEDLASMVQSVLKETKTLSGNAMLPKQIEMLLDVLEDPAVAEVARNRGGSTAVIARHTALHAELLNALGDRAETSPITSANERRDVLDGIVVTICRQAYTAAQLAARALGQPAIEVEFELTHLTPWRNSAPAPEPTPGAGPGTDAPAATPDTPSA